MPDSLTRYLWYEFWYCAITTTFMFGNSLRFGGRRNMPESGPALLIANHESFIDPILVGTASRRHLHYLARKTAFKGVLGWFLPTVNTHPVDQEGVAKEGLKAMLRQLDEGNPVLVFPEGERAWDGVMKPFRPGVHLLIRKSEAPIVPVGIAGAHETLPRGRRLPIPTLSPLFLPPGKSTIAVWVGEPIDSKRYRQMPREQVLKELFVEVKKVQERAEKLRRK